MTELKFHGIQTCEDYEGFPSGYISLSCEPKFDGYRLASVVIDEQVTFYCREDKPVMWGANLDHLRDEILELGFNNCMVDGEAQAEDWNRTGLVKRGCGVKGYKRPDDETMAAIRNEVKYHVFDWIDLAKVKHIENERKKSVPCFPMPLYERREHLAQYMRGSEFTRILRPVVPTPVIDAADLDKAFEDSLELGYEGIVLKVPASVYSFTRTKSWRKYKPVETIDLQIVKAVEGKGKYVGTLGTIECVNAEGVTIYVGAGTGLDDKTRHALWAIREELPGQIVEGEATKSSVGKVRHPTFKRLRPDRTSLSA